MASTYTTNSGIEKIASGEQNATWGDTTNTNWDIVDVLVGGGLVETLPAVGTSGAPNDIAVTDGAVSDGQNAFISFADGGDLGGTAYVRLTPNNAERVIWVQNNLSGSRSINVFQGTYDASNDITIPAGQSACVYFDGAGAGAVVSQINSNIMGLTIGTDVQAYDADLTAIAGLAKTNSNFIVGNGTTWVAETGATARASMGVTIGTDVQAYDADLTAIAALAKTNSNFIVGNGTTWVAETGATARTSLGLTIGTDVQAWNTKLDDIADLTPTDSNIIVGNGTTWVAETGATARTTLGLGTMAVAATSDYAALAGATFTGNVGIGETTPLRALHITDTQPGVLLEESDEVANKKKWHIYSGGSHLIFRATNDDISGVAIVYKVEKTTYNNTGDHSWYTGAQTERMRLSATGLSIVNDLTVSGDITAAIATGSVTTGTMTNAGNANQQITATGGLTMPNAIFTAGDSGLVRAGASARTITRGASVTMYVNGTNSATATLTARGVMGFNWESSSVVYLTGDIS